MQTADSFTLLDFAPGAYLGKDHAMPLPYAVWLDDEIIGSGVTASEAVEDARRTVRRWEAK